MLFLQKIDMERPLQATMIKVASSFSSAVLSRAKNATRRKKGPADLSPASEATSRGAEYHIALSTHIHISVLDIWTTS